MLLVSVLTSSFSSSLHFQVKILRIQSPSSVLSQHMSLLCELGALRLTVVWSWGRTPSVLLEKTPGFMARCSVTGPVPKGLLRLCCPVSAQSLSHVQLCVSPWAAALQAPLSLGFSRQEYWRGLPCAPPGDLPNPGTERRPLALQVILHHLSHQGSPWIPAWLASPLQGSSQPRNWTGVTCFAGGFFQQLS